MRKLATLLFAFLLLSCQGITYDGETKLVIKGKIVDENNQPIADKEVLLIVSKSGQESFIFGSGSEDNYIGKTTSQADGNFIMIIPQPSNFEQIVVQANPENNSYNKKQFLNIQLKNFVNYEFILPQTTLYQKTDLGILNITLNQINTNYQLLKLEYIGAVPNEYELINPYDEVEYPYNTSVKIKKNQTLIVKYTFKNLITNQISTLQQNAIIGNDEITNFTLNY